MTATRVFYAGVAVDAILLLLVLMNVLTMFTVGGIDGFDASPAAGLSSAGWAALWLIPLMLIGLMVAAFRLKTRGAVRVAAVLVWVPALPFLASFVLWGGLAAVFILFGR